MNIKNLYNEKNLKISNYDHGGSRIYLEDQYGNKLLICDTYGDIKNSYDMEIKEKIIEAVRSCLFKGGLNEKND